MKEKKNEIILFENQGVKLEVNLKDETVWLTQKQMAELFGKDRRTITRHIQNIYKDEELDENTVCSFFEHTAEDGKNIKFNIIILIWLFRWGIGLIAKEELYSESGLQKF